MNLTHDNENHTAVSTDVGDAVGMPKAQWFVAIVKNNTEKSVCEKLLKMGYDTYLPTQKESRIWKNGKRSVIDRVVIPAVVFINCTESERREIVSFPFINRFMTNKAGSIAGSNAKPVAVIPDNQIRILQFMLGNSDSRVDISNRPVNAGDKVKVIRGRLKGLEGEVLDLKKDKTELIVRLDFFGCARLIIDTINVETIP